MLHKFTFKSPNAKWYVVGIFAFWLIFSAGYVSSQYQKQIARNEMVPGIQEEPDLRDPLGVAGLSFLLAAIAAGITWGNTKKFTVIVGAEKFLIGHVGRDVGVGIGTVKATDTKLGRTYLWHALESVEAKGRWTILKGQYGRQLVKIPAGNQRLHERWFKTVQHFHDTLPKAVWDKVNRKKPQFPIPALVSGIKKSALPPELKEQFRAEVMRFYEEELGGSGNEKNCI